MAEPRNPSSSEFMLSRPEEVPAISDFLMTTLDRSPEANSFRPDVLEWKYFSDHPDWQGTRSYVVKKDAQIAAHGGIWPLRLTGTSVDVKGVHVLDWAANRKAIGAGLLLLRKIFAMTDAVVAIGGSEDTRTMLPKIGYKVKGEMRVYARVVRPWRHFLTNPVWDWKSPLRLLRNTKWSLAPLAGVGEGWTLQRISGFDASAEGILNQIGNYMVSPHRTPAGLNYILRSPAAPFSAFLLFQSHQLRGYFLLCKVGAQVRIADLRIDGDDPDCWKSAVALAARAAAEDPEVCEVIAGSSFPALEEALRQGGFRQRRRNPVFCYDVRGILKSVQSLNVSLLDYDAAFMVDPGHPFLC
jgi:hypothetical protein